MGNKGAYLLMSKSFIFERFTSCGKKFSEIQSKMFKKRQGLKGKGSDAYVRTGKASHAGRICTPQLLLKKLLKFCLLAKKMLNLSSGSQFRSICRIHKPRF